MANPENISVTIGTDQPINVNIQGYTLIDPTAHTHAHSNLSDMPDAGGTNTDHDTRYYTQSIIDTELNKKITGHWDSGYQLFILEN